MKILLIHQAFAALDEPGGTRHHELARYLHGRGHAVRVITGQGSYLTGERTARSVRTVRSMDDVGVEIWRVPGYHAWHRSFLHRFISFISFMVRAIFAGISGSRVDLVWGTSPPIFQAVSAVWIARLRRIPFLLEVRDLWPYFAVASGVLRSDALIRLSEWLERKLYQAADVVVVNSPGFVEHVSTRGAKRVEVIPNGVDSAAFAQEEPAGDLRTQLGLDDEFVVLYAGAHGLSNDLITVLEAAKILAEHRKVHFVLVGAGKEKTKLIAQAESMGLSQVHFLDPIPKQEIPRLLSQADAGLAILMAIDAYKTTYPNKVFDYMAAGLPVVCAIDGVIRRVVEEGQAGVFVQPGNPGALAESILTLYRDREGTRQMGEAGRRWVRTHFDRQTVAVKLEAVMLGLSQAIGGRDGG